MKIDYLDVHAEGEVGRILLKGFPEVPGETLVTKMNHINTVDDTVLKCAMFEPRGSATMTVNLLLPAMSADGHASFIPMQPDGAHAMSGSNAMCVATALIERGMVPCDGDAKTIRLDTPAGRVDVEAAVRDGKVLHTTVTMPVSFVECLDREITVNDLTRNGPNRLTVDVAFGGCYFAMIDVKDLGLEIAAGDARRLVELGLHIHRAAQSQIPVQHPTEPSFNKIEYVMFMDRKDKKDPQCLNATILFPGRIDRSPCGTGTSARLATMLARQDLAVGDSIQATSIIGGIFHSRIIERLKLGPRDAIRPQLTGRTWISAEGSFLYHPTDPFQTGYTLTDTWGTGSVRA